jgi:hypothetical protein
MRTLLLAACAALMFTGAARADAPDHPAVKRPVSVPPSVDLTYAIKARQKGFSIGGDATVHWRAAAGRYSLESESRAPIFGKLLETRSDGVLDAFGIAPIHFFEKRFRKDPYEVSFDRTGNHISFTSEKTASYPIKGGEQDRGTAPWQLAAVARGAPDKFIPGSEWRFFVAGRVDANPWTFTVLAHEALKTGVGELDTVHVVRVPPAGSRDQKLDIWLAPAHEWYPVRIRLSDGDDVIEQTVETITRR